MTAKDLKNLVVVSDLHSGCRLSLCPPEGARLDDGGTYLPSPFQRKLWKYWRIFWDEFVPEATRKEPYGTVINGDIVDGVHHRSTTQISQNLEDQAEIAYQIIQPIADKCQGRFWMIRGTEAHVGQSGVEEERLGKRLGAVSNKEGQHARYELWKQVGPKVVHLLHHIGSTGSQAYEATAVHKELVESFAESARWGRKAPDVIVRSHRHRHIETTIATGDAHNTGRAIAVVTPAWQGKTPFSWKIPGARLSTPQFGGIVIRYAKGELFVRSKVWTIDRSDVE
jgi:hypothetical protein